jgi:3-deoxy-manno-octulosonate cytidylyltransferase (CMP-KDO synthetase)
VAAALDALRLRPDAVINIQGDQPFLAEAHLRALCGPLGGAPVTTLAAPLADPADPARVKVVCDPRGRALYFSRAAIPHGGPYRQHVGLYRFSPEALARFVAAPPSPLERIERLEQLRLMEIGVPIDVIDVDEPAFSVDTAEDLAEARRRAAVSSARRPAPGRPGGP